MKTLSAIRNAAANAARVPSFAILVRDFARLVFVGVACLVLVNAIFGGAA